MSATLVMACLLTGAFNAVVCLLLLTFISKRSYRSGYNAGVATQEALLLGELIEQSRDRYVGGIEAIGRIEADIARAEERAGD